MHAHAGWDVRSARHPLNLVSPSDSLALFFLEIDNLITRRLGRQYACLSPNGPRPWYWDHKAHINISIFQEKGVVLK